MRQKATELVLARKYRLRHLLDLDRPLLVYGPQDTFTIRDAFEGVQVFGSPGSGKTSGSGQIHVRSLLRAGFGGLGLTAKANERERIVNWCQAEGRLGSLILVSPESEHCLNFMQYEMSRPGRGAGMTGNLASLFSTVMEREGEGQHADPFWPKSARRMASNSIDLGRLAAGRIKLPALMKIIRSAPRSASEASSESWQKQSFCFRLLRRASRRQLDKVDAGDLKQTAAYWLHEFPSMADKTRSSIVSSFTSVADGLLRGRLRHMFSAGTTFVPELLESGCIILIDIPTKEYHEAGQVAQNIIKLVCQRYWEGRINDKNKHPSFLYTDENQEFVTSSDAKFLRTAREAQVATVFITQNIPNYYAEFGGAAGRAKVDSLLGNLATKVFHANSDTTTNRYAEEIIGKDWQKRRSISVNISKDGMTTGATVNDAYESVVPSTEFSMLRQGGPDNGYMTEAIVFKAGKRWNGVNTNYLRVNIKQNL